MDFKSCTDEEFDSQYPLKTRKVSGTHWTPVDIAKKAISFLRDQGCTSVLDLGSGAGKFCLVAAAVCPDIQVTGVDQRRNLIQNSRKISERSGLKNLTFIQGDLNQLDFRPYDGFYFFNSFEENINPKDALDSEQGLDLFQYQMNIELLKTKFDQLPKGTCIVTYCGDTLEVPDTYELFQTQNKGKLKFWRKSENPL